MSYLQHFSLDEQPFRLTPDPDFVYWSKQHARAKAYMESTIWLADGFVVITGDIGSGKTTLLQSFLSELDDDVVYAVVSQTQLKTKEFLQAVLTEFGFRPFDKSKVELLDMLNMFLIEQYSNGKKVVLIVDEAQNLDAKVLEEIRLLSGIETHKEKVLRIILAGQPELKETLDSDRLKQLVQRVRLRFHLGPLDKQELREYIHHRLEVAGYKGDPLFEKETLDIIHRYTGGVPRLINTLCDTALLCAFAENKKSVAVEDIEAAVEELDWDEHESTTGRFRQLSRMAPAIQEDKDYLTKIEIRHQGEIIAEHLFDAGRVIIGRASDNEIFIKSKFVSRHHAQLITDGKGCVIEDLNSTNGIHISDQRVKRHRLSDGDVVTIGLHELIYTDLRHAAHEPEMTETEVLDEDEKESMA
ncbi:MAG: AAA family ATPase [Woeseiaceae bacterium]|nr:AAA family ATPase [Woeseiaceae bacterium]